MSVTDGYQEIPAKDPVKKKSKLRKLKDIIKRRLLGGSRPGKRYI